MPAVLDCHKPLDDAVHKAVRDHIAFAHIHCLVDLPVGARILDFGCGIGRSVAALLALGYDAYGVDITEHWHPEVIKTLSIANRPAPHVAQRLHLATAAPYRLPFPDDYFDFCFSDQVLEHVFDYESVFGELARVLKPNAVSVHRFPGPGRLMESHLQLPFPLLCRSVAYLRICALIGLRSDQQRHLTWHDTVENNRMLMRSNSYPSKRTLRAHARAAGVELRFVEVDEFLFRGGGRLAPALRLAAKLNAARLLLAALSPLLQRYMILRCTHA